MVLKVRLCGTSFLAFSFFFFFTVLQVNILYVDLLLFYIFIIRISFILSTTTGGSINRVTQHGCFCTKDSATFSLVSVLQYSIFLQVLE